MGAVSVVRLVDGVGFFFGLFFFVGDGFFAANAASFAAATRELLRGSRSDRGAGRPPLFPPSSSAARSIAAERFLGASSSASFIARAGASRPFFHRM